jgi:GNAT superfamily N-acetyltransferase
MSHVHVRPLRPHDEQAVSHLVAHVFMKFIAPLYEPEGITEFLQYASPAETARRLHHEHAMWVAESHGKLVGVIEVRDFDHISLLFVDEAHQRQGVAHGLVTHALEACLARKPHLTEFTVFASPNAVAAYERWGFRATGPEQSRNGMRFVPMLLDAKPQQV